MLFLVYEKIKRSTYEALAVFYWWSICLRIGTFYTKRYEDGGRFSVRSTAIINSLARFPTLDRPQQ